MAATATLHTADIWHGHARIVNAGGVGKTHHVMRRRRRTGSGACMDADAAFMDYGVGPVPEGG